MTMELGRFMANDFVTTLSSSIKPLRVLPASAASIAFAVEY